MDPKEQWKVVPGFSEYEVSNYGMVYSLRTQCLLYLRPDEAGYIRTEIKDDRGEVVCPRVHVLLMLTFVGPKLDGMVVNHKNGVKNDNRLTNLEYVTSSENTLHAYRTGIKKPVRGDDSGHTKIPDAEIPKIVALYNTGTYTMKEIGTMYGCSKHPIQRIISGKRKTAYRESVSS